MKQFFLGLLVLIFLFFSSTCQAAQPYGSMKPGKRAKSPFGEVADGKALVNARNVTLRGCIVTSTSAGDWVELYDSASASGTPEFDLVISANNHSETFIFPKDTIFGTDVVIRKKDSDVSITLLYIT